MLVSKKLPGICLVPIELKSAEGAGGRRAGASAAPCARLACYREVARIDDMNLDVVASFSSSASTTDAGRRTARLLPIWRLHRILHGYTQGAMYILGEPRVQLLRLRREDDALASGRAFE